MGSSTFYKKELADLQKKYRNLENQYILQGTILDAIERILEGSDEVSDFELSFGIVRQVADLRAAIEIKNQ